jgi:hypothetical protein
MLGDEITQELRAQRAAAIAQAQAEARSVKVKLTGKGIAYGYLTANADGSVNTTEVSGVNPDLRVRPFFAEGSTVSIREFVVGALNAEMGMESFDPDLATASAGGTVTTPSGMVLSGVTDTVEPSAAASDDDDPDGDGVTSEVPVSIVDHMEFYLLNYFKPGTDRQTLETAAGRKTFDKIGCNSCHVPDLTINHDRRVADVETVYDPVNGVFNHLFATVSGRFLVIEDDSGFPAKKPAAGQSFVVKNIFADFRRHDLGPGFWERNFDGTITKMFMTEPLWGVGSTAPYGHDARSMNLREVILRHGGEAQSARNKFAALTTLQQSLVMGFLDSLILFPPDDTASNLNPANPAAVNFPQEGHGSVFLPALFNNPADLE